MLFGRLRFTHTPDGILQNSPNRDTIPNLFFAVALIALTWLALSVPSSASAHDLGGSGDDGHIPGLGDFKRHGDTTYRYLPAKGEYEVRGLGQGRFFMHADPEKQAQAANASILKDEFEWASGTLPTSELAPICRTSGNRIVIVYSHRPWDTTPAPKETVRNIVRRMNWMISNESSLSSIGKRAVRMATECDENGNISIHEITTLNNEPDAIYNATVAGGEMVGQLFGAPYGGDAVKYLVFDAEEGYAYAMRFGGIVKNRENPSADRSATGVVGRQVWEYRSPVHELFHTLGAVQGDATPAPPGSDLTGHCGDSVNDIMCSSGSQCSGALMVIDCNKDTYFSAAPKAGTWLAEHWNLAGEEDPFLVALPTQPPKAETNKPTSIRPSSAVLHGIVTPKADYAAYYFEYGTTTSYGKSTPAPRGVSGFGTSPTPVSTNLTGLAQQTTYHYRVVAVNDAGEKSYGADQVFETVIPSATLCKAVEENSLCTTENRYATGTTVEANSNLLNIQTPFDEVYCESSLKAKTATSAGLPLLFTVTSWTLSNCYSSSETGTTCSATVQAPVQQGTLLWASDSQVSPEGWADNWGTFTLGGEGNESLRVKCTNSVGVVKMNCAYEVNPRMTVEAEPGYDTFVFVSGSGLKAQSGECPVEGSKLAVTYKVASPKPLYVAYGGREPTAVTEPALAIEAKSAMLKARINPQGPASKYHFEYDTAEYKEGEAMHGSKVPLPDESIGSGTSDVGVSNEVKGLAPSTTYHFRVVATNELGTSYGKDATFKTCQEPSCQWSLKTTSNPEPRTEAKFEDVSCPSSTVCIAAGQDAYTGRGFGQLWNGSEWKSVIKDSAVVPYGATCSSAVSCEVVGTTNLVNGAPVAERWYEDEVLHKWHLSAQNVPSPAGSSGVVLQEVSCTSASACTAVGGYYNGSRRVTLAERWNGSEWTIQSTPNPASGNTELRGISCASSTSCKAVGTRGSEAVTASWNGSEWTLSLPSLEGEARLEDISCASSTSCMAVGRRGSEALTLVWNGTSWSVKSAPTPSGAKGNVELRGVVCLSSSSCTAVGSYVSASKVGLPTEEKTLAESWNGSEWTIKSSANMEGKSFNRLNAIACSTSIACAAVGGAPNTNLSSESVTLAERWDGSAWSLKTTSNPEPRTEAKFEDVSCPSSTVCIAAGQDAYTGRGFGQLWNGSEWKSVIKDSAVVPYGATCSSAVSCEVVGTTNLVNGAPVAERWYEDEVLHKWHLSAQNVPSPAGSSGVVLQEVSCTSASACTAVGGYYNGSRRVTLAERWNGSEWTIQSTPNPASGNTELRGISCASSTSCKAVGTRGSEAVTASWNGSEWTLSLPSLEGEARLEDISCASSTSCMAVGRRGSEALTLVWNGTSWSVKSAPTPSGAKGNVELRGVVCLSSSSCTAVGSYVSASKVGLPTEEKTLAESWNGSEWTIKSSANMEGKSFNRLNAIACSTSIACAAVGGAPNTNLSSESVTLAERWE